MIDSIRKNKKDIKYKQKISNYVLEKYNWDSITKETEKIYSKKLNKS